MAATRRVLLAAVLLAAAGGGLGQKDPVLSPPESVDMSTIAEETRLAQEALNMPSLPPSHRQGSPRFGNLAAAIHSLSAGETAPSSVPVVDELPSMSPYDGLDAQLVNGPLPNPHPSESEAKKSLPDWPTTTTVASAHDAQPFGSKPPLDGLYLTPGSNLPPTAPDPAVQYPRAVAETDHLKLPDAPDVVLGKPAEGDVSLPSAESLLPTFQPVFRPLPGAAPRRLEVVPTVPQWYSMSQSAGGPVHYSDGTEPGLVLAPQHEPIPELDAYNREHLTGEYQPPTTAFEAYLRERSGIESLRRHALASLAARRAAIDHARQYVEGGEAWVNKMKAEWDAWLEKERSKGSTSIVDEERRVGAFKKQLEALQKQQEADMELVNKYNTQIRKALYDYQLAEHKKKLEAGLAAQDELKKRLAQSEMEQAQLQQKIDGVNKEMGKALGSAAGGSAGSSNVASAQSGQQSLASGSGESFF